MKYNLLEAEDKIMSGLKDFQRYTVDRIFNLYKSGQKRVLVADEVGLGKTLIAKGLIAKSALYNYTKGDTDSFKVAYICSNQNIAKQNISKLKINSDVIENGIAETRLSTQHLKIYEQRTDAKLKNKYVQLIPLTPHTSFALTRGAGTSYERAIMFAILKRMDLFKEYLVELEIMCRNVAFKGWIYHKHHTEARVVACDKANNGKYLEMIIPRVRQLISEELMSELRAVFLRIRENNMEYVKDTFKVINPLRAIFAEVSLDLLEPDLVIMDEFQRFKFLLNAKENTLTGILVNKFLKGDDTHVLLLSATPYKLYSTLEEIKESEEDEHYSEFFQVVDFLIDDIVQEAEFRDIWSNYSMKLRQIDFKDTTIIEAKNNAEDEMYKFISRTEREMEFKTVNFIDDSSIRKPLKVNNNDVLSYMDAVDLLETTLNKSSVPIDYVKSSPYLFSFMKHYKLKKEVENYFKANPLDVDIANRNNLWLNEDHINNYQVLEKNNAKLEMLKEVAFENNSEKLLWIPPSQTYYPSQGVFKDVIDFSKILVFSAWEMVPRMISSLLSYESERKTVGELSKLNHERKNTNYFTPSNMRYPVSRLNFRTQNDIPYAMNLFCLLYPSESLARIYNPIDYLNKNNDLEEIENELSKKIKVKLKEISSYQTIFNHKGEDTRWYFLAPLLFDSLDYVKEWLSYGAQLINDEADLKDASTGFNLHLDNLKDIIEDPNSIELGNMPDNLVDVLVDMAIASPAICAYRTNGHNSLYSSQFSKVMINMFNKNEATAIVELSYGKTGDNAHWQNVLKYCKDGNLQSVFDEYVHMLTESNSLTGAVDRHEKIHKIMIDSIQTHTATYNVDTFKTFKNEIQNNTKSGIRLRSHFAVGFYQDGSESQSGVDRKDSIRNAFNSPFRPFVLATTSIGQEGLDFHYYCRKIMHWNLPSNPVDLEQREGRINRFKCHAIRQKLAYKYKDDIKFQTDVWTELFNRAELEYKDIHSELVPFWVIPDVNNVKIERIVPLYPLSQDNLKYERLIKILSLYRMTLGQAKQEKLIERVIESNQDNLDLSEFFINLSPYHKENNK